MPHTWDIDTSKIATTEAELVPKHFKTLGALQKSIQRYKDEKYGIKQLQRACYGRPMLVDFDSLPRHIQNDLGDPRKCAHIMEKWYKVDNGAVRFYTNHTLENGTPLSPMHQEEYIINASVLIAIKSYKEAHEDELNRKGKKAKKIYEFMTNECIKFQETLKAKFKGVQHSLPTSDRRFREAFDNFFASDAPNYESLISGKIQNENAKKITDRTTALLDSIFAKAGTKPNKLTVARRYQAFIDGVLDVINAESGEMYNPADFKALSERSVTKWLSEWESKIGTYALRSADRQKLRGQFSIAHERERPIYAGSLISVDDRQPPFEYAPSQRLWVYNCLDVASDVITATVWGKSKEGMILDFYRQIVRNYTEWGFRLPAELEAESSLNSSYKESFLREGAMFDYVRLEANNARGKIIERRNRDFRLIHERELDGFIGRWHARDESNQPQPKDNIYLDQKFIAYDKVVQQSLMVIEDWNNMPHPDKPEMSRWDYFASMQSPQLHPTNWKGFLPHLGYKTKTSCNVGKIRVQGVNLMIADHGEILFGEALISRLKVIEGEDLTAYWLDGNKGQLLKVLIYMGDSFVCEGIPTPKYNHARIERNEQDEINLQIQARYTATVEGFMTNRKRSIEEVVIIDHRPKTLNNNFQMPGLNRNTPSEGNAEMLDDNFEDDFEPAFTNKPNSSLLNKF